MPEWVDNPLAMPLAGPACPARAASCTEGKFIVKLRRSSSRRAATVVGLAAALVAATALTASAITGGEPDGEDTPTSG